MAEVPDTPESRFGRDIHYRPRRCIDCGATWMVRDPEITVSGLSGPVHESAIIHCPCGTSITVTAGSDGASYSRG